MGGFVGTNPGVVPLGGMTYGPDCLYPSEAGPHSLSKPFKSHTNHPIAIQNIATKTAQASQTAGLRRTIFAHCPPV